ncbi:hypothetical protein, partial [Elstera cyanobacteriorum]|uniref:hypothetical protein n=1 Tax=Elstera cyanobacteriorum TaxID=2022747 RepID=UPI0023EFFA07
MNRRASEVVHKPSRFGVGTWTAALRRWYMNRRASALVHEPSRLRRWHMHRRTCGPCRSAGRREWGVAVAIGVGGAATGDPQNIPISSRAASLIISRLHGGSHTSVTS